jgi:hypothetical protein
MVSALTPPLETGAAPNVMDRTLGMSDSRVAATTVMTTKGRRRI